MLSAQTDVRNSGIGPGGLVMECDNLLIRHSICALNPALIESWCLRCGSFIAASGNAENLQTAENSHICVAAAGPRSDELPR